MNYYDPFYRKVKLVRSDHRQHTGAVPLGDRILFSRFRGDNVKMPVL